MLANKPKREESIKLPSMRPFGNIVTDHEIFFDTNVYIAEALLGEAAEAMLSATEKASWRICVCDTVLGEIEQVMEVYDNYQPPKYDASLGGSYFGGW